MEVKGKYITLASMLLSIKEDMIKQVDEYLDDKVGLTHEELDPEEWYEKEILDKIMEIYAQGFADNREQALINLGKRTYHTFNRTIGIPPEVKTPKDYIQFENLGYQDSWKGVDPREFVEEGNNYYIIKTVVPFAKEIQIGVWLGMLEIAGEKNGQVKEIEADTYKISW